MNPDGTSAEFAAWLEKAVGAIRYGSIEIVIHDGRIVQIERKEPRRYALDGPAWVV
ncbi:MAG: YezD family protein [Gammaproteobacteria bacterium]